MTDMKNFEDVQRFIHTHATEWTRAEKDDVYAIITPLLEKAGIADRTRPGQAKAQSRWLREKAEQIQRRDEGLAIKVSNVKMESGSRKIKIESKYDPELVAEIKKIPGRAWEPTRKAWYVDNTPDNERAVRELTTKFGGEMPKPATPSSASGTIPVVSTMTQMDESRLVTAARLAYKFKNHPEMKRREGMLKRIAEFASTPDRVTDANEMREEVALADAIVADGNILGPSENDAITHGFARIKKLAESMSQAATPSSASGTIPVVSTTVAKNPVAVTSEPKEHRAGGSGSHQNAYFGEVQKHRDAGEPEDTARAHADEAMKSKK